ncbi:MAG: hypothetical protein ABSC94_05750 [Polyangiaceae bacterium]
MKRANVGKFGVSFTRVAALAAIAVGCVVAAIASGCGEGGGGGEGDRCNPYLSHNECNGSLTCQTVYLPATAYGSTQGYFSCGESICCPTPASSSTNVACTGVLDAPQLAGPPPTYTPGALQCPLYCSAPGTAAEPPSLTGAFTPASPPVIMAGGAATVLTDGGLTVSCPGDNADAGAPDGGTDAPTSDAPAADAPLSDAPAADAPLSDAPAADAPLSDAGADGD